MEDEECVFCFEDLNKYDIALLNCPHKYHLHCIQNWNKKSKKYNIVCPQCNIDGEIINIVKGKEDAPLLLEDSPPPSYNQNQNQNQILRFPSLNPNMQQYTYYPIPIFDNLNDSSNSQNQNNRLQAPNYLQQTHVIYQNEYFNEIVNPPQNANANSRQNVNRPQNANRRQNANRYEDEPIEPFICCNIL